MENAKARREAAFLVVVVFALGILLGGVGNHLWGERVWGQAETLPHGRDEIVGRFTRDLDLSAAQQKEVAAIVDDTRARWRALYAPLDGQKEAIRQQSREKIRALLTPEQKIKFQDFLQRLDEQRKKEEAR